MNTGSFALTQQLERLYLDNHRWLTGLLRRQLGDATDAADLSHDIYLKLMRRGCLPSPDESRCHLTQMAKGMVIDLYRRRRVEARHLESLAVHDVPVGPCEESRALLTERLARIDAALHEQSPKARQALLLHRLEGMPQRDIAATLQVSVSSVEKYIASGVRACHLVQEAS